MKSNIRNIFWIVFCLTCVSFTHSGNDSIKEKVKAKLKSLNIYYQNNPNYMVKVKHILYTNTNGPKIDDSFQGYFKTVNGMEHSLLLGIETIQNKDIRVGVDTATKIVTISPIQKSESFSASALEKSINGCKKVTMLDTSDITIINFYFDKNKEAIYKIKLVVNENRVSSVDMWHNEKVVNSSNNEIDPHTRIEYSSYKEKLKLRNKYFNVSGIVEKSEDKYKLTSKYKGYRLYDLRAK